MKRLWKEQDLWLRLLSLLLAVVIWMIVRDADNPVKQNTFRDIPVVVVGEDILMSSEGLSLIENTPTVDVTVEGPNNEITDASLRQRIVASVDVSNITEGAGEYNLPVQVTVSSSAVVNAVETSRVSVRVDKVGVKTVPVRVDVVGMPAEGYRAGKAVPTTTDTVAVEGPQSELREVAYAYATIDVAGKNSTVTGECTIALFNDAGETITGKHVTCQTDSVSVRVPLYPVESVPLTVTLKDSDTIKSDQATVAIAPEKVMLLGDQNTLANITEINLGTIDLDNVRIGVPIEMEIPLPEGVRLDEGQPSVVNVTITVDGVATRKAKVTKFVPTDTTQEETPYTVDVLTESVEIELRGSESALDQVDMNSFSIGLTFDSISLGKGIHKVKGLVAATGLPTGVTIAEVDVEVEIEIKDNEPKAEYGAGIAWRLPPVTAYTEEERLARGDYSQQYSAAV